MERRIGCGTLSEVWQGTDLALTRTVAVKLVLPELAAEASALARFRSIACRTGSVSHPGVARIFDYGEPEPPGRAFVVTEFLDGRSLAELLQCGPLPAGQAMDVLAQAADAVHAAHLSNLAGLKLTTRSILLSSEGTVKLKDLGPAWPANAESAAAGAAGDLRALGDVVCCCLAGQAAAEPPATGQRLLPSLPSGVPADAAELTWRLLTADAERLPDSSEIGRAAAALADPYPPGRALPAWPLGTVTPAPLPSVSIADAAPAVAAGRLGVSRAGHVVRFSAMFALVIAAAVMFSMLWPGAKEARLGTPRSVPEVTVDAARLIGRPVRLARTVLRKLGLHVLVRRESTSRMPPGLVVSIRPAGRLPRGSLVRVIGAVRPDPAGGDQVASPAGPRRRDHRHSARPTSSPSPSPQPSSTPSATPSPSPSQSTSPAPTGTPTPPDSLPFRHRQDHPDPWPSLVSACLVSMRVADRKVRHS